MKTTRLTAARLVLFTAVSLIPPTDIQARQTMLVDGVAAVVNGDVITLSEVMMATALREREIRQNMSGEEAAREIKKARAQALDELIDRKLIVQEFNKKGLTLPERFVRDRIESLIREEFGGDRAAFIKTLRAQGLTLKRFEQMENEKLIVHAMRQQFAGGTFVASPSKVEEYYRRNIAEFSSEAQVLLRMITLAKKDSTGSDNRRLADEIVSKIRAGSDFSRMAQLYSEDSNAGAGGEWGWTDRKTLNPEISSVAFSLKPGEVSDVIETPEAYFILKVESRRGGVAKPLSQVRQEVQERVIAEQKQAAFKAWTATLRKKAYIKIK